MARKSKQNSVTLQISGEQLDIIAEKIAEVIGKEITRAFACINFSENRNEFSKKHIPKKIDGILIDERIIPTNINTDIEFSSKELGEEEVSKDKGLSGSKKKLANLFKNK
jgi:hypothetical protein